ncbi:GlxA family transcriptional regulator [Mesorhizobium sp. WSM3868]|uniref:GlxA family transcriptional regulator n=1 Tax=Mesorhizobium sp. WSM3868 TaxID=2029405 RepID=UPI000BB069FA|nr:GlxA family transcriptional regulator [Mesorhizobium sp. WSM3868]PBB30265.1 AraC family transcriptional regulator [Mesorhizobium sp. WSM3868]
MIVVCGGQDDENYSDRRILHFLRSAKRHDALVGGVSTGSFLLAKAGLLGGCRCTTHWDYIDSFRERFPDLDICSDVFAMERGVFTCGGGIAAMDVMLEIIRQKRDLDFANSVAENFVYGGARRHDSSQRMSLCMRLGVSHPTLLKAVSLMEMNSEVPLRLPVVAKRLNVSQRQLERLFEAHLQCTPAQYYLRLRLSKAESLLRHSALAVYDIAVACGFGSATNFSRAYRLRFGCAPSAARYRVAKDGRL